MAHKKNSSMRKAASRGKMHAKKLRIREYECQERCPVSDKHVFTTRASAEEYINTLHSNKSRKYGTYYLPRRSYLCDCGGWHVTSKPLLAPFDPEAK